MDAATALCQPCNCGGASCNNGSGNVDSITSATAVAAVHSLDLLNCSTCQHMDENKNKKTLLRLQLEAFRLA